MIEIDDTLVSADVLERRFVCDLAACKGACCVQGDSGAPLEDEELEFLDEVYDEVKPYMRPEGIAAVEKVGVYGVDFDQEFVTPLVNNVECAYVNFDDNGTAKCAIEQAYIDGKTKWKKPISCHLYPVRLTKLAEHTAVNYHSWKICAPACACGDSLDVKVYKFLKEPLTRKFGSEWYEKLVAADQLWEEHKAQNLT
jgi:hypothetical protein